MQCFHARMPIYRRQNGFVIETQFRDFLNAAKSVLQYGAPKRTKFAKHQKFVRNLKIALQTQNIYYKLTFLMAITYKKLSELQKNFLNSNCAFDRPNLHSKLQFYCKLKIHSNYDPLRACIITWLQYTKREQYGRHCRQKCAWKYITKNLGIEKDSNESKSVKYSPDSISY